MKDNWRTYALLALAALAFWFFQVSNRDTKQTDSAQWQAVSKAKECMLEEISKVKERVAKLEGYHEHEKTINDKGRNK
jgi:hypothetical protein